MEGCEGEKTKCRVVRSINLAYHHHPKPDMQFYNVCAQAEPCIPMPDGQIKALCIKVCNKDEFKKKKSMLRFFAPKLPSRAHGKVVYAVKAGILVGTIYFTYSQGIWGDQQDLAECFNRWQEYKRSIKTRRPPQYDSCGNVIVSKGSNYNGGMVTPVYMMYKNYVTSCFSGLVKLPKMIKRRIDDYQEEQERKKAEQKLNRKMKKSGGPDGS